MLQMFSKAMRFVFNFCTLVYTSFFSIVSSILFDFSKSFPPSMSASPSTLRETLRGHNIFWLENVEISSSYELTKSDLAALLRGDPHSYLHGLFQSHTPDRVKVNIPPHVRQLRSLLLDSNSLFDNENGIEKLKPAVIERYNSEKGCILSTHPQSKEEILQSHWKDLKGALQSVLTSDAAFFKKYFFDGFTRSGTQFPGLSTSG